MYWASFIDGEPGSYPYPCPIKVLGQAGSQSSGLELALIMFVHTTAWRGHSTLGEELGKHAPEPGQLELC